MKRVHVNKGFYLIIPDKTVDSILNYVVFVIVDSGISRIFQTLLMANILFFFYTATINSMPQYCFKSLSFVFKSLIWLFYRLD